MIHKDIGEPLVISDYFKVLKDIEEIVDVVSVEIVNKVNGPYSGLDFDVSRNSSADGRVVTPGKIQVFELKYPDVDIRGTIV